MVCVTFLLFKCFFFVTKIDTDAEDRILEDPNVLKELMKAARRESEGQYFIFS